MKLNKKQLELTARACLWMAADQKTTFEEMDELDNLYDYFMKLAEEVEEE
jgi:hypothetical protein